MQPAIEITALLIRAFEVSRRLQNGPGALRATFVTAFHDDGVYLFNKLRDECGGEVDTWFCQLDYDNREIFLNHSAFYY